MPPPFREHPLRETLVNELHSRASEAIQGPAQITHLAVLTGEANEDCLVHLADLCSRMGTAAPAWGAIHFTADMGGFSVRFERHTEFCSYSFIRRGRAGDYPFEKPALSMVPEDWLASLPGEVLAGVHIVLEARDDPEHSHDELSIRHFAGNQVMGASIGGGAGRAYSDLRLHADRFHRILLRDVSFNERHAGRTVQRLIEVNTYRAFALLALPQARKTSPILRRIDTNLANIAARMADGENRESDEDLLAELSQVTAEVEAIAAQNSYRFAASQAYYQLVQRRLEDLRQTRIDGLVTFTAFMERRLSPAMATCDSVAYRTEGLSERGARIASLLRARVEVDLQAQNKRLLESMDRRVKLQVRLQEAVEGLSVVAISYYLTGLLGYLFKGAKEAGLISISDTLLIGLSVPVVVLVVFFGLKQAKKAMGVEEHE